MPTIPFLSAQEKEVGHVVCPPPCNSSPLLARIYNMGYYVPLLWTSVMPLPETTTLTVRAEPWPASMRETGKMHVIGENLWLPSRQ